MSAQMCIRDRAKELLAEQDEALSALRSPEPVKIAKDGVCLLYTSRCV